MAYTKVFAIRARLDDRVKYAVNGKKTELDERIVYPMTRKTDTVRFVTTLNCRSARNRLCCHAENEKEIQKTGGVLGYHLHPILCSGEVTPEQAHESGASLRGDYSVRIMRSLSGPIWTRPIPIITSWSILSPTRTATSIIPTRRATTTMCAVPQTHCAGRMIYPSSPRRAARALRRVEGGAGRQAYRARRDPAPTLTRSLGKPTPTIPFSCSCDETVTRNAPQPNRKYTTVKPPGAKRAIRWTVWARGYTEADILLRLSSQRHGGMAPPTVTHAVKRYRMKGSWPPSEKEKSPAFTPYISATSTCCVGAGGKKLPPKLPFSVKREVIHLERYEQQFKYLLSSGITTETELEQRIRVLEWDIRLLEEQRKPLYQERRNTSDEEAQAKYSAEIQQQTAALREKRRKCGCAAGYNRTFRGVSQQCQQAQAERQENLKNKEEHEHEYQR